MKIKMIHRNIMLTKKKIIINNQKMYDTLISFYNNNIDNDKFDKYYNKFIPFNKSVQGNSGGTVGFLSDNENKIIKINKFKNNIQIEKIIKINENNVNIDYRFNEIIINFILSNFKNYIPNIKKNELLYLNKYIIKTYDFGFTQNVMYFINEKVGIEYQDKFITNTSQLLMENHIPLLNKAINENNIEILKMYDMLFSQKLNEFINAVIILQKYIDYINTDLKLNNIFIKKETKKDSKFDLLRDYGFITDFRLMISDLDKASITINKMRIFPLYGNNNIIKFIRIHFLNSLHLKIRHQTYKKSIYKKNSFCDWINYNNYDLLCITISFFVLLYNNIKNFYSINQNHFININNLIEKQLSIEHNKYIILHNVINKKYIMFNKLLHTSFIIIQIINKYCSN